MTTATTAKIITLAGNPNPPSLVALYGGSLGERKTTIADLENDLYAAGLSFTKIPLGKRPSSAFDTTDSYRVEIKSGYHWSYGRSGQSNQ